jgi:hypothetical protein
MNKKYSKDLHLYSDVWKNTDSKYEIGESGYESQHQIFRKSTYIEFLFLEFYSSLYWKVWRDKNETPAIVSSQLLKTAIHL